MTTEEKNIHKSQLTDFFLLILRIAANDVKASSDFNESFRNRLKFQKQTDWKRFRASVDLIDDTECAIISAFTYQLGDLENDNHDYGELNIRLYGILNAVYLQMNALEEIAALINYSSRDDIKKIFRVLDIYKLRGIAAAHTSRYEYDEDILRNNPKITKITSFRIVQSYLEKTGENIVVLDENDIEYRFGLISLLTEYEDIARNLMFKLIKHSIANLIEGKKQRIDIENRLEELFPKLIDYTSLDKNKGYGKNEYDKLEDEINDYYKNKN